MSNTKAKSRYHAVSIYILMALFLCFEMALQVSPGVMTQQLRSAMHLSAFGLGLMSGVYFVTYTFMQIPSGLLLDRTNFRHLVTLAILICATGTLLFSFSSHLLTGCLARLLTGFGSAFAFLSVLTVAARYFHRRYFAFLVGVAQFLAALGAAGGVLPVAYVVHHAGWRQTLLGFAIFAFVLAAVIWLFIRKPKAPQSTQQESESIWASVCAIFRSRQGWACVGYGFFSWAPMTAFASLWGVPFLRSAYGFSTQQASLFITIMWLGVAVTAPTIGALSDMIQRRNPLLLLTAILGAIGMGVAIYVPHLPLWLLGVLLAFAGVGAAGQILSFAVVQDSTEPRRLSTGIGLNNMALVASGIVFQPLTGKLLEWHSGHVIYGSSTFAVADYHVALGILPLAFICCALITLCCIRETHCRPNFSFTSTSV